MANTRCRGFFRYWVPALLYAGLLFWLSSLPAEEIPPLILKDTLLHLVAYAVFGSLLVRALRPELRGWSWWLTAGVAALGSILYGMTDEFHQSFVPSRSPGLTDLVMDGLGGMVGGFLFWGYVRRRRHREEISGDRPQVASL